ncbi:Fe-S protein [Microbacterium deminutum]|uniref:Fe-S protein n=1 Tax=Microbacterium deminutum TaxID=344164 RepID=A0ABN2Q6C5_9MICO
METLRGIVVIIHLIGFAILFGAWAVEAFNRRMQVTRLMQIGLGIAGLAGLILAIPFGISYELNYVKLGVKLLILIVIGALLGIGQGRQKKTGSVPPAIFWSIGILTIANASIAVLWR